MTTPRSRRLLWLRPVLFLVFTLSLPFTWSEELHVSCDGQPLAPSTYETGIQLLFREPEGIVLTLVLMGVPLALFWLATRAGLWLRIVAHVTAALATGSLFVIAHFSATFSFGRIRVHPAAYIGLTALALAAIEALSRALLEFAEWLKARQVAKSRGSTP